MKSWPVVPTETVFFDHLVDPLAETLKFVVENGGEEISDDVVIPYDGYTIGLSELVTSFDPVSKLSPEQRAYDRDDQGRNIYQVIIGIAVQLGVEQGRRFELWKRLVEK